MNVLRNKGAPRNRMEINPVFEKINRFKILGEVISGQDPTRLSFHLVKRNKKQFRSRFGGICLYPSIQETEAWRSLNSRSAWYTEQVPGQEHLRSRGNHHNQKASEEVIEPGGHLRCQQKAELGGFSQEEEFWDLPKGLMNINKAWQLTGVFVHGGP